MTLILKLRTATPLQSVCQEGIPAAIRIRYLLYVVAPQRLTGRSTFPSPLVCIGLYGAFLWCIAASKSRPHCVILRHGETGRLRTFRSTYI